MGVNTYVNPPAWVKIGDVLLVFEAGGKFP